MAQPETLDALDLRLARGEITEEEYDRIRARLDAQDRADQHAAPHGEQTPSVKPSRFRKTMLILVVLTSGVTTIYFGSILIIGGIRILNMMLLDTALRPQRQAPTVSVQPPARAVLNLPQARPSLPVPGQGGFSEADLDEEVAKLNQGAPKTLSEKWVFDQASRSGTIIVLNFTMLMNRDPTSDERIIAVLKPIVIRSLCTDLSGRQIVNSASKIAIKARYQDSQNPLSFSFSSVDCPRSR